MRHRIHSDQLKPSERAEQPALHDLRCNLDRGSARQALVPDGLDTVVWIMYKAWHDLCFTLCLDDPHEVLVWVAPGEARIHVAGKDRDVLEVVELRYLMPSDETARTSFKM